MHVVDFSRNHGGEAGTLHPIDEARPKNAPGRIEHPGRSTQTFPITVKVTCGALNDLHAVPSDDIRQKSYDPANRLNQAEKIPAGTAAPTALSSYIANGLNQRVLMTTGTTAPVTTSILAYDEAGHLIGHYVNVAKVSDASETVWLGDMPVAIVKPANTFYVHTDYLNTPRQISNASQDPVWAWEPVDSSKIRVVHTAKSRGPLSQKSNRACSTYREAAGFTGRLIFDCHAFLGNASLIAARFSPASRVAEGMKPERVVAQSPFSQLLSMLAFGQGRRYNCRSRRRRTLQWHNS